MSPPPLQGKQPRRCVAFDVTTEEYDALLFQQSERRRLNDEHVAISRLARDAFEQGIRDEDGRLPGAPLASGGRFAGACPRVADVLVREQHHVDTGRLRDNWSKP